MHPPPHEPPMDASRKQLEYDNIEGMILLSELSRRRIRSIQKLIRVGRNEVVVVLRVDREKGIPKRAHFQIESFSVQSTPRLHRSLKTPCVARRHHQMRRTLHEIQSSRLYHATRRFQTPRR